MGLFSKLKQLNNAAKAGGNYGFIAQNVAAIYYATARTPFGRTLTDNQRLFATGLIDVMIYIQEGSITTQDVADAVMSGQIGEVSLGFYTQKHRGLFDFEDNATLIGLTMQLEAMIFQASNMGIGYRDIVNTVVQQKPIIVKMINKTLKEGTKCNIFNAVMQNTSLIMEKQDFQELVLSYK